MCEKAVCVENWVYTPFLAEVITISMVLQFPKVPVTKQGTLRDAMVSATSGVMSGAAGWPSLDDDDDMISYLNPSYANGNVNTTSQDVYEWIPTPLSLGSELDIAREFKSTTIQCV